MTAKELKDFEDAIGAARQHTNKQTFGADADDLIAEVIDTPGVSISGRVACLITAISVTPNLGIAGVTHWTEGFRTQFAGGVQAALLMPDDPKFIAEKRLYMTRDTSGDHIYEWPMVFDNPTKPMLVVNPKMTILHVGATVADLNSKDVYTQFSYMNVQLTLEMHMSLLNAQMNQS